MVGCVVVRDGVQISCGWHDRFGGPHAEVNALSSLTSEEVRRADLFLTLEPCTHFGKTPPCLDLLLRLKPRRVVIAMLDPFPQVAGRGVSGLRAAGVAVDVGVLESEAQQLNAPYLKRLRVGLPWVIAKWAMTLDGAIATSTGDSKWITGEKARASVHRMRARMDAILVGSETVLVDDPLLTARVPEPLGLPRKCIRVVLDRRLRIPLDSQLIQTAATWPLWIATTQTTIDSAGEKVSALRSAGAELVVVPQGEGLTPSLEWLLRHLSQRELTNVMVEGGGTLLGAFFDGGWVDQVECFIAPRVLGSSQAKRPIAGRDRVWMNQTAVLDQVVCQSVGEDIHISGFVRKSD
jgi:diaminohydroxyphosphoribosylaminopyrimidine deaminase/5-amino-6-(5-phosphoribosylamino)uracil reductase